MRVKSISINGEDFPVMGDGFNITRGLLENARNGVVSNVEKLNDNKRCSVNGTFKNYKKYKKGINGK